MSSRHPADEPGTPAGAAGQPPQHSSPSLVRPGFGNACLCYLLVLSALLSPLALVFAFLFAEPHAPPLQAHYFYIRTTIALMVIGFCLAVLMIVVGAVVSTFLILAGLALLALTAALTLARCCAGFIHAFRRRAPRNYRTYFI
ncbi:hypothetical protein FMN50_16580 [Rhodobacterales bacterium]|nr:hypothetical protein FMN50_16580 [Rhodobacterales bacterium]